MLDEIRKTCPEVDNIPGAINGFGLLQAVQHYPKKGAGKTTSVNFLHFTMQEYLSALYVSRLNSKDQLSLMKKTFWDSRFNFMWMMYVGITGVNSEAFSSFTVQGDIDLDHDNTFDDIFTSFIAQDHSGDLNLDVMDHDDKFNDNMYPEMSIYPSSIESVIDSLIKSTNNTESKMHEDRKIYDDKRKCLHLFQCYMEAESGTIIPSGVSSIFTEGEIVLNNITLLPHHISSLIFFMSASSMQQWKVLDMHHCNLGDIGMNSLLEHVIKSNENMSTLKYVDLSGNKSSPWGVYCAIIRYCCVDSLTLCGDEGMKEYVKEITGSLQTNASLHLLTLCNIKTTSTLLVIKDLLISNKKLKELNVSWNNHDAIITCEKLIATTAFTDIKLDSSKLSGFIPSFDEEVKSIVVQLLSGLYAVTLHKLIISYNRITDDGAIVISECLKYNSTLRKLDLAHNYISCSGMKELAKFVNHNHAMPLEYVDLNGNKSSPWGVYCAIIRHCRVDSLTLCGDEGMKDYVKEIMDSLQENAKLQSLTLYKIGHIGLESIKDVLSDITTIKELNLSRAYKKTNIIHRKHIHDKLNNTRVMCLNSQEGVVNISIFYDGDHGSSSEVIKMKDYINSFDEVCLIAFGLYYNTIVKVLDYSNNEICDNGAMIISDCLKHNTTLRVLNLSQNHINLSGMNYLSKCIQHAMPLEYVDFSENMSSPWGVYCAIIRHCCVDSLTFCGDEGMKEYVEEITDTLQRNAKLQSLTLCKIGQIGLQSIKEVLSNNISLKELNVSWKGKGTKIIHRQLINMSTGSNEGHEEVMDINILYDGDHEYLPEVIDMSNKDINDDIVCLISFGLHNNTTVKKLDLSWNKITNRGALAISDCIRSCSIHTLILSNNSISYEGAKKISENMVFQKLDISYNNICDQ